jgi:nonsense-mediated mRNA decay protein 3
MDDNKIVKQKDRVQKEKWTKFCPQCGKQTDELFDSVCKECFKQGIRLIDVEKVEVSVCPHCGCYFKGKDKTSIDAVVEDAVRNAIRKRYGCDSGVVIHEVVMGAKIVGVVVDAHAAIKGVEIAERGDVTVILKRATCERCSKIAGGYYAGIVQIRAEDRIPTDDELVLAEEIAYASLGEVNFISKEVVLKEGLDLYVSSMECGRRISNEIVRRLGGSYSESQKLYGRKDGKNIYRVSFSVRLPGFKAGDMVQIDDRRISVEEVIEGRGVEGVDIDTGEKVFVSKRETTKARRI